MQRRNINVDGAVRDEDTFVVGDDDDESGDEQTGASDPTPPPPYVASLDTVPTDEPGPSPPIASQPSQTATPSTTVTTPAEISKYYIKPGDNLQGIALRFGVNASLVCTPSLVCS